MKIKNQKTGKMEDVRLPKQFKTKWLKALRSGEFKQGKYDLRNNNDEYCCLGVAAKISGASCITGKSFITKGEKIRGTKKIPTLLKGGNWGYDDDYNEVVKKLSEMNDKGKTFKQIAAWIDKNL